jgi:Bacterial regulatory proteins, lacI family
MRRALCRCQQELRVDEVRRPTMADVAALAGVSNAVVSYVLNGRDAEMRISKVRKRASG